MTMDDSDLTDEWYLGQHRSMQPAVAPWTVANPTDSPRDAWKALIVVTLVGVIVAAAGFSVRRPAERDASTGYDAPNAGAAPVLPDRPAYPMPTPTLGTTATPATASATPSSSVAITGRPTGALQGEATRAGATSVGMPLAGAAAVTALLLDNFDASAQWSRSENDIGEWTGADSFANGGGNGDGVVSGGGLALEYSDDGWFGSDVFTNVSAYRYLVLRVKGAAGGKQRHFKLALGGMEKIFGDYTMDGGAHPVLTTAYQDFRIPMAANAINTSAPRDLQMSFWWGGRSTVFVDEIRFE